MIRLLKQSLGDEKGQALLIVLGMLAIGGLTIAVSLNYATANLNSNRIIQEDTKGVYAAAAGVEYALWSLREGIPTGNETPENINQMGVDIRTEDMGTYILYLDGLFEPESSVHSDWVTIEGNIVLVGGTTSNYTTTIAREEVAVGNIRLTEVGAVLPMGYTYIADSAASFPENLSVDNPTSSGNTSGGARWLKWLWGPGQGPLITTNHTQAFQIDGTGSTDGAYTWLVSQSGDVGTVGEITGSLYRITSTATRPEDGKVAAEIRADVIIQGEAVHIFSWEISN